MIAVFFHYRLEHTDEFLFSSALDIIDIPYSLGSMKQSLVHSVILSHKKSAYIITQSTYKCYKKDNSYLYEEGIKLSCNYSLQL